MNEPSLRGLLEWVVVQPFASLEAALEGFADEAIARGSALERAQWVVGTLHPLTGHVAATWQRGQGVRLRFIPHVDTYGEAYRRSPLRLLYDEGHAVVRRRLCDADCPDDFGILPELRAAGITDYAAAYTPLVDGKHASTTVATRAPGGFSEAELAALLGAAGGLSRVLEIFLRRRITENICDAYLGRDPGRRVQQGSIRRGDVEHIQAVVWFCDLRGFTALSAALDTDALLALLGDYFELVGTSIQRAGGEILKFIGDAVLAIFPCGAEAEQERAVESALGAADEMFGRLAALNERRAAAGGRPIALGVGLHLGDVAYGNIGTPDRLDFTVIGRAVNLASRLEGLCGRLDEPLVVSEAVALRSRRALRPIGDFTFKGIPDPARVFGLRRLDAGP